MVSPLFLAASLAFAAAGPATDSPHSANWGPDYKKKVQEVFDKLLKASAYDHESWLAKENRKPTKLIYSDKYQNIEGSPAVAVPARVDPNTQDYSIVACGYGLLEFVTDEDELAFILGHEIAHLAGEHARRIAEERMRQFDPWYDKNSKRLENMDSGAVAQAFAVETDKELAELKKKMEREADANGLNLMTIAGFDRSKAETSLKRAQDWLWAAGDKTPDTQHDPLWMRVKQLHEWRTSQKIKEGGEKALKTGGKSF